MTEAYYTYKGKCYSPSEMVDKQLSCIAELEHDVAAITSDRDSWRRVAELLKRDTAELTAEVARLTAEVNSQKRQISFLLSERKECKECGRGFDNGSVCGECLSERDADLLTRE